VERPENKNKFKRKRKGGTNNRKGPEKKEKKTKEKRRSGGVVQEGTESEKWVRLMSGLSEPVGGPLSTLREKKKNKGKGRLRHRRNTQKKSHGAGGEKSYPRKHHRATTRKKRTKTKEKKIKEGDKIHQGAASDQTAGHAELDKKKRKAMPHQRS